MTTVRVRLEDVRRHGRVRLPTPSGALLVLWVDGRLRVLSDECPHRDLSLTEGVVRNGVITCPAHLWQFDVCTGLRHDDRRGVPLGVFSPRVVPSDEGDIVEIDVPDAPRSLSMREVLLAHARAGTDR